jgi:hypothetical protein
MSAYAELPSKRESKVEAAMERAGAVAGTLGQGIGGGLREAGKALAAPKGTDVESLLDSTNLPAIDAQDPLQDLAHRLDREGDLWRNLAFRELANARWSHRMLQIVGGLMVVSSVGLAVLAGLGGLFGGSADRAVLIGVGALVLALGAAVFALVQSIVRRGQREALREALARADLAELRLHRVAVALAARSAAPEQTAEVLARLERDARG